MDLNLNRSLCSRPGVEWTRAPGAIIAKCEVEVIVIKLDIEFSEGGDRFA